MKSNTARDTTAIMLAGFIGVFIVGSMIAIVAMAFNGVQGGENIWAGLFSLATAILGGIGGYLGGTTMERQKYEQRHAPEPPTLFDDENPLK